MDGSDIDLPLLEPGVLSMSHPGRRPVKCLVWPDRRRNVELQCGVVYTIGYIAVGPH
jgi:hypothetical protein